MCRMMKLSYFVALMFTLIFFIPIKAYAIDPADLVEVTPENDPYCVEYYNYKDSLYCSTTGKAAEPLDPAIIESEKLNIVFDDRPWKMAWGKKDERGTSIEYVPNGEDINSWYELVTSQFFPGLQDKVDLEKYAHGYIEAFKADGYNPIVTFHEETPERVILEFRLEAPQNQIQDEIQMITKDDKGIYVLHYVIKEPDMGEENRNLWLQNLKDSTIKE